MKILLTGFEPFGQDQINPALETIKLVNSNIGQHEVIKLEIPTVFNDAANLVIQTIQKINPDCVISIGQAGGSSEINVEFVGINYRDARIADNKGQQPKQEKIIKEGPDAYFSTLPVVDIVNKLKAHQIPATISYSAGTFVCNEVLYRILHYIQSHHLNCLCGFIHVPYLPSQTIDKPSMPLETIVSAIEIVLETLSL